MAMKKRLIRITLSIPGSEVVLKEDLNIRVRISKAALSIQNKATIEISGMSTATRESLLSQFTAWNKRLAEQGTIQLAYIPVKIEAGYLSQSGIELATCFVGQVVLVEPYAAPPDITVKITCFTRQFDKAKFNSNKAPAKTTFYKYVEWAAQQMEFGTNFKCETSYNNKEILNPARSIHNLGGLLIDIQNMYRPDVVAFVDDDVLIVKDRDKVIDPSTIPVIKKFIGIPTWTEWGVEGTTMFDPQIKVASGAEFQSIMNPGINGQYVIMTLEYDLCSRDRPFYVKIGGCPPA